MCPQWPRKYFINAQHLQSLHTSEASYGMGRRSSQQNSLKDVLILPNILLPSAILLLCRFVFLWGEKVVAQNKIPFEQWWETESNVPNFHEDQCKSKGLRELY